MSDPEFLQALRAVGVQRYANLDSLYVERIAREEREKTAKLAAALPGTVEQ